MTNMETSEDLTLQQLKSLMAEHMKACPADLFSPERTPWSERKDLLQYRIDLAEGLARLAWKPASGPARGLPQQSGPSDFSGMTANPVPSGFNAFSTTKKATPRERLDRLVTKLIRVHRACTTATNAQAFEEARQTFYQARFEINQLVRKHKLQMPTLPESPSNSWKKRHVSGQKHSASSRKQVA